jgi:predicted glutamine amidotransferase
MNDSLALFLLVAQQLDDEPGWLLADALTRVIQDTVKAVTAAGETASLNLVIASADEIVASRTSANTEINSLYIQRTNQGSWVASEPLDSDETWTRVPDHTITVLTADNITTRSIEHDGMSS